MSFTASATTLWASALESTGLRFLPLGHPPFLAFTLAAAVLASDFTLPSSEPTLISSPQCGHFIGHQNTHRSLCRTNKIKVAHYQSGRTHVDGAAVNSLEALLAATRCCMREAVGLTMMEVFDEGLEQGLTGLPVAGTEAAGTEVLPAAGEIF